MRLSILIPTVTGREQSLKKLLQFFGWDLWAIESMRSGIPHINTKAYTFEDKKYFVEFVVYHDNRKISTGSKRNCLIDCSCGKYIVFVDDDDELSEDYIKKILEATEFNPDVITFNGYMTTNGTNREDFRIELDSTYETLMQNGKKFYKRFPNHLCPMRRDLAIQVQFENISYQEDYKWAKEIESLKLLKTSVHIEKDLYHYKYQTK